VDVIFACGGDGTAHEVLQGVVCESGAPDCAMGVIPMGSANALARHLGISLDPCKAALDQARGKAESIPVGKISCGGGARYFVVMAGAGPDGALVYSLLAQQKTQLGRLAYYLRAARLFATRRFSAFEVEFTPIGSDQAITQKAVSVMAVRVDNLGGLFSGLTSRHASIRDPAMQLCLLSPPALLSLPLWFLSSWIRAGGLNPMLQSVEATAFNCRPIGKIAPHIQADGEWIGRASMEVTIVPNAVRMMLPIR
jgi:diacylglycerol kinase family enzyme